MEERRELNRNLEITLARLDERTKFIKATLVKHIDEPPCGNCQVQNDVVTLKNNVMWIKRISASIAGLTFTIIGIWKGLS